MWQVRGGTLTSNDGRMRSVPLGIVMRKTPGVTRWVKWNWMPVAVLPFADESKWKLLRSEGECEEYHAATLPMELHAADAEAYMAGLATRPPCVYVVMRQDDDEIDFVTLTASPYEAQDYADTGEEVVEKVVMPEGLVAIIRDFANIHYEEDVFIKRKRRKWSEDRVDEGKGDARISQLADVYRAPSSSRKARIN